MKQGSWSQRGVPRALLVASLLLVAACGGDKRKPRPAPPPTGKPRVAAADAPAGLELRLSSGQQSAPSLDRGPVVPTTKLGAADVAALLARVRPLQPDEDGARPFAFRPSSQPPPRTGATTTSSFPPPPSSLRPPPAPPAGADLQVVRWMPEGAVPLAPELSVTFSQPMVAVTSQADAAATTPVTLTPTPPGRWRWIGTRTIVFDPEVRFPQATTYTVEVPAGTKSASGAALNQPVRFSFETPPPTVVTRFPDSSPQRLDVPMFVAFDQRIDPQAVLAATTVTAYGKPQRVRMLTASEVEQHAGIAQLVAQAEKDAHAGRWLAFRTLAPLPADAEITVEIAAGTPSAEGPNRTGAAQRFSFRTYPPLRLERAECGWGHECRPGMPLRLTFNNPLDEDAFDDQQLVISPAIPGAKIVASHSALVVHGLTKARTTYTLTVARGLTDAFGQTLGTAETRTFRVGDAQPTFFGPRGMVVLDPAAARPTLDFFSTGYPQLKVQLYQVTPADYDAYGAYLREQWNRDRPPPMPGKKVLDQVVDTKGGANELVETSVELAAALGKDGLGHAIAVVEPHPWKERYDPPRFISWVQSTRLAVDAYVDAGELIAFATELEAGKPAAGVALELRPHGLTATTDDQGLAKIALGEPGPRGTSYVVARRGDDVAFVAADDGWYGGQAQWVRRQAEPALAWYVIDDRRMYKPGEEVTLRGWLRTIDRGEGGDVAGIAGAVTHVTYKVSDARGNQIATGSAPVSSVGGWHTRFTLPKTPNLGDAQIELDAHGRMRGAYTHAIQIQEFRRPEFEVTAQASQGPFVIGGGGDVTVAAKYYAGGPLGGAPTRWQVSATQTRFTPPNRDDYVFGAWQPWWGGSGYHDDDEGPGFRAPRSWSFEAQTDASGAHTLHLDFVSVKPALPTAVTAHAFVTDVNRQTWSAAAPLIVHPSLAYVGLKARRAFVDKGTPFELDVIGVDLDGKPAVGAAIEVKAVRLDWEYRKGRYATKEVEPQTCAVVAVADPVRCRFETRTGGSYRVTATIVDAQGRPNETTLMFWVSGGERPPEREVAQEEVQLIPDKPAYVPGDTAELLVQAPFHPAEGVVSWRRSGIVKTARITLDGPTTVIRVPITDAMVPNLYVQVDLVGAAARTDDQGKPDPRLPKRPAYAVGTLQLPVPPKQRTLAVRVTPGSPKLGPGERTTLALEVTDAAGRPVADAEAAVLVVDEAILALTGYQFPSPLDAFYERRGAGASDHYLRAHVKLASPGATQLLAQADGAPGAADMEAGGGGPPMAMAMPPAPPAEAKMMKRARGGDAAQAAAPIAIRTNFNPLAAFAPAVKTDARGRATVAIEVPDNLTRYRIVAIASAGETRFGKGEDALTARLPLMIRPSPPRFLNFGDTFELPVVVQNQTDAPMTVRLAVRTSNATLTDGAGREVQVAANDRALVQFPAAAARAGTARFVVVGAAGAASDAAELALPVWTPATTEAFATYGAIDDGAIRQPVALPGQVVPQFGGLEITTASTNLQALTDALLYLVRYPFECAEQRASRVLAIAALRDVLTAFAARDLPSVAALEDSVAADVERLRQLQNADGGFAFWARGYPSDPYVTVHVTNALARARAKGYAIPDGVLEPAQQYLRTIEQRYPDHYGPDIRRTISSYALYTRAQLSERDVAKAQQLLRDAGGPDKLSMEANGWLLGTLAGEAAAASERAAIVRHALNRVSETAGAAGFTTSYGDGAHLLLASDRRVDAVLLEALIQEQPTLDLIPKLVTGLLAHRKAGRWLNTQENSFALAALDRYFQTYEKVTPDLVARVWLGEDYAGDHAFRGRTTDQHAIAIPMSAVAAHDGHDLTIQKAGRGRLYYRIGMTYAPASLQLGPADHGFVVERRYEAVDDPKDVARDASGAWRIKAGARVRVHLTMVNEHRRYHVALVDPLPAGLEPMNPALAVTGPIPTDPAAQTQGGRYGWWYRPWYEHQNLRDERVEAFTPLLWEGVHAYTYVARATTPGSFIVPPPKAEEMYMPETFGRGASDRVIIE